MSNNLNQTPPSDATTIDLDTVVDSASCSQGTVQLTMTEEWAGQRLDKALSALLPDMSRNTVQQLIKDGKISVDEMAVKQTYKLEGGERVSVTMPQPEVQDDWQAEDIPLDIVHEDESLMVVNKHAGLVVHPGAGNSSGTLLNAILHHCPQNATLARAGIVHRLDKDTSGLMVIAKTEPARLHLIEQLSDRTLSREYLALTVGTLISGGSISQRMNRDRHDRRKMTVVKDHEEGKEAITHYRIDQRFRRHTLLKVKLETGRTHQIRVHMTYKGFPLVGDPVYGKRLVIPKRCDAELERQLRHFKRQALHATAIAYEHPVSGETESWRMEMPQDMQTLCQALTLDASEHE